jgi:hypothetical protein
MAGPGSYPNELALKRLDTRIPGRFSLEGKRRTKPRRTFSPRDATNASIGRTMENRRYLIALNRLMIGRHVVRTPFVSLTRS